MKRVVNVLLGVVVYAVFCTTFAMGLLGVTFGELFGGVL